MNASRPVRPSRSPLTPRLVCRSWAASSALALLLYGERGAAQAEAQKPAPNVLLLVDSSGSMELKADGSGFPLCDPTGSTTSEKSRWINLIEVLTGRIKNYRCWGQQRRGSAFSSEFSLSGVAPYDLNYVNPYHRALSDTCTYGAGTPSPNSTPFSWETNYVKRLPVIANASDPSGYATNLAGSCTFEQETDGLLDTYERMVRFGLMTFDTNPNAGTGLVSPFLPGSGGDPASGVAGTWSYYVGGHTTGYPVDCAVLPEPEQEVGARNAAAPPWEGRMVAFGPYNEANPTTRNRWIQDVLLATRPYGATPIAGQLDDARQFLYHDATRDPLNPSLDFGPYNDANWKAPNCRKTILILLTDGEPNLDLRPFCDGATGKCPYREPEKIVEMLYEGEGSQSPANMKVETYVIGFGLPDVNVDGVSKSCAQIESECGTSSDPKVQACCTLNKIAAAGGRDALGSPRKAYFASSDTELKSVFSDILDDVIQVATRTMPVFSSPGGDTVSKGYKFFSAFDPQPDPTAPRLWEGILERRRYKCNSDRVVRLEPMTPNEGDDFAANLSAGAGLTRRFYTVEADGNRSARSVRPHVGTPNDGLGDDGGVQRVATGPAAVTDIITPNMMQITGDTCTGKTAVQCRDLVVQHLVGLTNADNESRCVGSDCKLLGAIYHSVPTPVPGRPSELLRDESYESFAAELTTDLQRPSVLYTSTIDGFLHAFRLAPSPGNATPSTQAVTTQANNELWSFIPPAVLPHLYGQYPDNNLYLLDGVPIIKDVVATRDDNGNVLGYERLFSDAEVGAGTWRTVLVQGFGAESPVAGYFALDITEPDRATPDTQRPTFRWQLTTDEDGEPLFGKSGTPLITTVFLDGETDQDPPTEVPVAVLPGGDADDDGGAATSETDADFVLDIDPDQAADYGVLREGRYYPNSTYAARSLTIVRLDTGEVIRTFRPNQGPFSSEVYTYTDLDAPITGQPKAFPETTGAVADRIYVGDRDGRLWRVDVSSQDPERWTMKRMFDAFRQGGAAVSQPVVLPPVLSVDEVGDVTIAFATGSQELDNSTNHVLSLTERLNEDGDEFEAHLNWVQTLDPGDRVTGNLVLFNSALYYAVSRPPETTGASCDVGSSKVYGVHYVESADFAAAQAADRPPEPSSGPGLLPGRESLVLAEQAGLVFGVSLEAEPACASGQETITGNDSFGYGTVQMSKLVTPGKLYLSYSASGNTTGDDNRGVLEVREELPTPRLPVTFQSWAPVYE